MPIELSENGQRAAGLVLVSRACHVGKPALLLGEYTTGDRAFIRMWHLGHRPTRFEVENTCCWWLAIENGCAALRQLQPRLETSPTLAALPLGLSTMLVPTGLSGFLQSCASLAQVSHKVFGSSAATAVLGVDMCAARLKTAFLTNHRLLG